MITEWKIKDGELFRLSEYRNDRVKRHRFVFYKADEYFNVDTGEMRTVEQLYRLL